METLQPNSTIIPQLILFLITWFVLSKMLFKPMISHLDERHERTEGAKAQAQELLETGGDQLERYESGIRAAAEEAAAKRQTRRDEAMQKVNEILRTAQEEIDGTLDTSRADIRKMLDEARQETAQQATAISKEIAEKLLGHGVG